VNTSLDCIPCLIRQSLKIARVASSDSAVHEAVLRDVLHLTSGMNLCQPPLVGKDMWHLVCKRIGVADPYLEIKKESNRHALALYPQWKEKALKSENPLLFALKLSIAANSIDFGGSLDFQTKQIPEALERSFEASLSSDSTEFLSAAKSAKDILFLADNAGELVFDRLLLELLMPKKITVVVKGGPALNDALMADAQAAGLPGLLEVIDNGADLMGTQLPDCSPEFRKRFQNAELIISKGQANYESLEGCAKDIFFLLKVKCAIVAQHIGFPYGSLAICRNIPKSKN